jgi:hypothetical protein
VDTGRADDVGVGGGSAVLDVDGVPVFVKRVPLTDRELAHPESTANLFDLPVFCQYGMGGPSFNAWRELAANIAVTEAVLAGETQFFPVLHHWRVLPGRSPVAAEHADIDTVVASMGDSLAVRARLAALAAAPASLVLFSEFIPHPAPEWLGENPADKAATVGRQFSQTVAFLRGRGLLRRRSRPRRRAASRGRDPDPARTRRREDERLLLEAVRRGHPRGVPRFVS